MRESGKFKIRPSGRHILTIGRDLVQDPFAAVIELVKNAYDADSPDVVIAFERAEDGQDYIRVSDHGHGMSRETVINKWLVPSTSDKGNRKGRSPSGRIMQGRKGIGRFAASILGNDLRLETTTRSGENTTLHIRWDEFEQAEFLEDVAVNIDTEFVKRKAGTTLTIGVSENELEHWAESQLEKMQFELRKLMPPFPSVATDHPFKVILRVSGIPKLGEIDKEVDPFPLVENFDYRIMGTVNHCGDGSFVYSQQKSRNFSDEEIKIKFEELVGCGELELDIRVYDRDSESLEQLIQRGLRDESGEYLGKQQARTLLNVYNGIGVYRNGFRLRPLGDAAFDWLKLNEQRVQHPSFRIGNNQVIGYVQIQSEELSNLIEKSARDGLIENEAFEKLKGITKGVIGRLEEKRYLYRSQAGLGRRTFMAEQELEKLYSLETLKKAVFRALSRAKVDERVRENIGALIEHDEKRRRESVQRLRDTIAVYQGHATLGKIINVVLHEGRRPLNYFRNQFPLLEKHTNRFAKTQESNLVSKIVACASGISENAKEFVRLFSRLDPLAAKRRSRRKMEKIVSIVNRAFEIYSHEMGRGNVKYRIMGDESFTYLCWRQDIQAIFANLVDNSIYWLGKTKNSQGSIETNVVVENGELMYIDYHDSGPGIEPEYIDSGVIFDPQFTTKPDGTGLGLAIAGESAIRNRLTLKALKSESGAWFRLEPLGSNNYKDDVRW